MASKELNSMELVSYLVRTLISPLFDNTVPAAEII
jgi:hypothetical protein